MIKEKIKEDDIVLCTVKRIEGTTAFLDIKGNGQGSMIFSEVSPGRIRNIRDFIVINKKIVCKVLRIKDSHTELSLRRVTAGERDEVLTNYKKEKVLENMIKTVLKEQTQEILDKIKQKYELPEFLDEARENPQIIKKLIPSKESEKLIKIFSEKKEREREIKKKIKLKSYSPSGLLDMKKILKTDKAEIKYLGSSSYSITVKAKDYKKANTEMENFIEELKQKAKKYNIIFDTKLK